MPATVNSKHTQFGSICHLADKKRKLLAKFKLTSDIVAFLYHSTICSLTDFIPAMMMNYFRLIEPYLHGSLSPEEQLAFERQLVRNPALANEFTMHFSLVRVLFANPDYPLRARLKALKSPARAQSSLPSWLWHACAIAVLSGMLFGFVFA